ncbi:MAG: hypothetical protein LBI35_01500 [Burkholderiales bacterium]|jgi:hypothetical protein|nr:hypothetical protein [Burkholderiales bacterium]
MRVPDVYGGEEEGDLASVEQNLSVDTPVAPNIEEAGQPTRRRGAVSLKELGERHRQKRYLENFSYSVEQAAKSDPDLSAKAKALGTLLRMPEDVVERNMDAADALRVIGEFNDAARASPAMLVFWQNPYNATLSKNDIPALSRIERMARMAVSAVPEFAAVPSAIFANVAAGIDDAARYMSERTGTDDYVEDNSMRRWSDAWARDVKSLRNTAQDWRGNQAGAGWLEQAIGSGVMSFIQMLPILAAAVITRSPAVLFGGAGLLEAGHAGAQALEQDVPSSRALAFMFSNAVAEILTEKIPAGRLIKSLKEGDSFLKMFSRQLAVELPQEQVAEIMQGFNEWAYVDHPNDVPFQEFVDSLPVIARQTFFATLTQTLLMTSGGRFVNNVAQRLEKQMRDAEASERFGESVNGMVETLRESNMIKLDPQAAKEYGEIVAQQSGLEQVYIDGDVLYQSGLSETLAKAIPPLSEQIAAATGGGNVSIRMADFLTANAQVPELDLLREHLRVHPDGLSDAETRMFRETGIEELLRAEVDRAFTEMEQQNAADASREAVAADIKNKLDTMGRWTPDVNERFAALPAAMFDVYAKAMGTTAEQLYRENTPNFQFGELAPKRALFQRIGEALGLRKTQQESQLFQPAYHGTPYRFDKFTLDHIGSGEGNQAYGWGLYFAGDRKVAEYYRETLSDQHWAEVQQHARYALEHWPDTAVTDLRRSALTAREDGRHGDAVKYEAAASWIDEGMPERKQGQVYKVDVPEDNKLLSYDKPLSAQPLIRQKQEEIKTRVLERNPNALADLGENWSLLFGKDITGEDFYNTLSSLVGGDKNASVLLNGVGVPGLRYLDGNNRPRGKGSHNYVIFDDNAISVLDKFYQSGFARERQTVERATPERSAKTIEEARNAALVFVGKAVANDSTGFVGVVSRNTLGKMVSDSAVRKSESLESHLLAVANADKLFQNALLDRSHPDVKGEHTIKAIHRFVAPMITPSGDVLAVKITAKETTGRNEPNPIYTIETIDVKKPVREAPSSVEGIERVMGGDAVATHPTDGLTQNVAEMVANVKRAAKAIRGHYQNEKAPLGAFNPDTLTYTFTKDSDFSTFVHETGHFFLEMQARLSTQLAAQGELTPLQQRLLADNRILLDWFGVQDLNTWNALSLEEQRSYHEKFAVAFEKYLFTAEAPSVEVRGLFQRFRDWLTKAYRNWLESGVELSDDVRGVMDRMLATDEQIAQARESRRMAPLFESAEQVGMPPEAWQKYQDSARDLLEIAKETQQTRGLRDMQYLSNAKGRVLKQLQKQAEGLRREVRSQVRSEVMSEPVYQVWSFLTRKMTPADDITQSVEKTREGVAPTIDPLFVAVAKLGGLNRDQAVSLWGIDPVGVGRPVFGKPVLRAKGGMTIDEMAQALAELGYLTKDEHGKADLREFEEAFGSELFGDQQYSVAREYASVERSGDQVINPLALGAGRLDAASLRDMGFEDVEIALLSERGMVAENGLHPDLVAALTEFDSGDALVNAVLKATPPQAAVEAETDARMLEKHAELATPEAIERSANAALTNEALIRMTETEWAVLDKALGKTVFSREDYLAYKRLNTAFSKKYAETLINRTALRDIAPSRFYASARKEGAASEKAFRSGDIQVAADAKRRQVLQNHAARAANSASEKFDREIRYLRKFAPRRQTPNLDAAARDQINILLERFGIHTSQPGRDTRETLAAWAARQAEETIAPSIPDWLMSERVSQPFRDLTFDEFQDLTETIRQIEFYGRKGNEFLTHPENKNAMAVIQRINESVMRVTEGKADVNNEVRLLWRDKALHALKTLDSSHRAVYSIVREFDGFADGELFDAITRPMDTAGSRQTTLKREFGERLYRLSDEIRASGVTLGGQGKHYAEVGRSLNLDELLAIALNWGNAGNRQRLLDGYGWTEAQVAALLNNLTSVQARYVQGVWDLLESMRPLVAELERRTKGVEPKWVERSPFTIRTADGETIEMAGGYYPAKYDNAQTRVKEKDQRANFNSSVSNMGTRQGYTMERAGIVKNMKVLLSTQTLYMHIDEVIHDLSWREWAIDMRKLMNEIDPLLRRRFGAEKLDSLYRSMASIVDGNSQKTEQWEQWLIHLRNGSTVVGLGLNVRVAALQPFGISNSIVNVGGKWILQSLGDFATIEGVAEKVSEINGLSEFMRNRSATLNREMNDVLNEIVYGKSELRRKFDVVAFLPIQKMQALVDYPTWNAAYLKAQADQANYYEDGAFNRARAIALADSAVIQSQSSGMSKDLAPIQRGSPLWKLWTNFYSFFATVYQLTRERTAATQKTPESIYKLAVDYSLLLVVPAIADAAINALIRGTDDDDDMLDLLLDEQIGFLFGLSPITRELGAAVDAARGEGWRRYTGPAGLRGLVELTKLGQQAGQGELDWGLLKAAINTGGVFLHLPTGQLARTIEGTMQLIDGETDNPFAVFGGRQRQ